MKQDLNLQAAGKTMARLLLRYSAITYVVFVAIGLSTIVYFVSQTILSGSEPPDSIESVSAGFDTDTIEQLESLSQRSQKKEALKFPDGQRINPFSE